MSQRLFTALELPQSTKEEIVLVQKSFEKYNFPINWVNQKSLHLTINFLGRISDETLPHVQALLKRVTLKFRPIKLTPYFLETMYKKHEDSYVYLNLIGDTDILEELFDQLSAQLAEVGVPQPRRYFPHITLGRLKKADPISTKAVLEKIRELEFQPLSEFVSESVILYSSLLSKTGSTYQQIAKYQINL